MVVEEHRSEPYLTTSWFLEKVNTIHNTKPHATLIYCWHKTDYKTFKDNIKKQSVEQRQEWTSMKKNNNKNNKAKVVCEPQTAK